VSNKKITGKKEGTK